jgi:MFS family permease
MEQKASFGARELSAVILLSLVNFFLFADQNLMAPNLTHIARDFGLNDIQRDTMLGGNISFVFWILGGAVTLFIGYLTDKFSRKMLFLIVVLIGSVPCFMSGFVRTYDQLFWMRALTGIGIGGALPLSFSLIGDYFSHNNRSMAAGFVGLAQGLGIAAGQMLAGFIGNACVMGVCGWRLPFVLVAVPAIATALLFGVSVAEPARGRMEEDLKELIESGKVYTARINWKEYRELFRIKTNILLFLQGIPGTVPWGVFFIFMNDFFSQDKGFTIEMATLIIMAVGAGAIIGAFLGGLIGNKIYNINHKYLPILCGATTLAGIIPMAFLISYPSQAGVENPSAAIPAAIGFITGFIMTITGPNVKAILLNVNSPETRGSIFSLFNLTDDLGKGFGPVIISQLIFLFGRVTAFHVTNLFWLLCGVVLLTIAITFPKDKAALDSLMKERAKTLGS